MTTEVTPWQGPREVALLKAIGFDRLAPEQRELALRIAERYDLDPLLRHIAVIDGKPVITRDGLLHVAHKSGHFDGISVQTPTLVENEWRTRATVWRDDMSHPFEYDGRFPDKGRTGRGHDYPQEMAIKVAESMALRRAFDVSAPVEEERWANESVEVTDPPARLSLAEVAASKAAEVVDATYPAADEPDEPPAEDDGGAPEPAPVWPMSGGPALAVEVDVETDVRDITATAAPALSKAEFNRRAIAAGITKARVSGAHSVLGLPPSEQMTDHDWGSLAVALGLS